MNIEEIRTKLINDEKLTQNERIYLHLYDYGTITPFEAFREYGITRLAAVVFELRRKYGIDVETTKITEKNRYNENISFAEYSLTEVKK